MYQLERTDSTCAEFRQLVSALDKDLAVRDGDEHAFFAQFNKIASLNHVVVAYKGSIAVGCGAIKHYAEGFAEVKRMYVLPDYRGNGIAAALLHELEHWAQELGYAKCILETGIRQPEAIGLYKKCGYNATPNYGQYEGVTSSVCFEKDLINAHKRER